jgi:hypothetical protein
LGLNENMERQQVEKAKFKKRVDARLFRLDELLF